MNKDRDENKLFYEFDEPVMSPKMMPTYKKLETREYVKITSKAWIDATFRLLYKEPWYKSNKIKKVTTSS